MITITVPVWFVWMLVGLIFLQGINTVLDIMIHYRRAEIEKLKRDRVQGGRDAE